MPNFKPELSIIIVNYRSEQYLQSCLASLFNNLKYIYWEAVVVNNDENRSLEHFNQAESRVKIVDQQKNIGYGAAANLGAKRAVGETLLFLNPDTELIRQNYKDLLAEFKRDENISIIGPKLLNPDGTIQAWSAGAKVTLTDIVKNNLGFSASRKIWASQEKREAAWVSGAAMFVRAKDFKALGGFDEKFFLYFEDVDLCRRAINMGKQVIYFPGVGLKHFSGKSHQTEKEQKKAYYLSQDYYFKKHQGALQAKLLKILRKIHV